MKSEEEEAAPAGAVPTVEGGAEEGEAAKAKVSRRRPKAKPSHSPAEIRKPLALTGGRFLFALRSR